MTQLDKSKHTFAICAYKESRYLEECITSLKKQSMKSKIILITSTPNRLIDEVAKKYQLHVYVNQNGGIVQDWNYAYEMADTDYVTITHQDDVYYSKYTEQVITHMEKSSRPIICFTDYFEIRRGKTITRNKLLKIKRIMLKPLTVKWMQNKKIVRRRILAFGCPICCPSVTIAKKNVKKAPFSVGFRSDEDWEAWEKLSKLKGEFIYIPIPLIGHRIHQESETTAILKDNARAQEDLAMFKKFWPEFIAKWLIKLYSASEDSNDL